MPGRRVPPAPAGLAPAGLAIWQAVWSEPQIQDGDAMTVERLARLECEAADLRAVLQEDGPVLRKPTQSARGEIIGEERYSHPAIADLRKIGAEAASLCDSLGLTPYGRKRLGLVVLDDPAPPDAIDHLRARRERRLRAAGR
jgi:P27 family predicted phage terminase small subunit